LRRRELIASPLIDDIYRQVLHQVRLKRERRLYLDGINNRPGELRDDWSFIDGAVWL
jgi:hypothetical protein